MAKKKDEKFDEETQEVEEEGKKISPITQNFGSEELNLLRDKINEIISK